MNGGLIIYPYFVWAVTGRAYFLCSVIPAASGVSMPS